MYDAMALIPQTRKLVCPKKVPLFDLMCRVVSQSSAGLENLDFVSHCLANVQPILDCFIPSFKLKYGDSENTKADRVNTVVFNLHQIKQRNFLGYQLFSPEILFWPLIKTMSPMLVSTTDLTDRSLPKT